MLKEKTTCTTQYIRTDKAIVNAFCALLKRLTYEEITIQDILDETPISRAAFYQHFTDKEAIAEQLMDEYLMLNKSIIDKMNGSDVERYSAIVTESMKYHPDLIPSLLKIHTERVDLKSRLIRDLEQNYLAGSTSEYRELEAQIYASALSQYQVASMERSNPAEHPVSDAYSVENIASAKVYNHVMIEMFLKLMRWSDNDRIRQYLHKNII